METNQRPPINMRMSPDELSRATRTANETNSRIRGRSGMPSGELGRNAFLRLLVTELRHQDPTQPMEDREFISQMAQFSSLEQMTNINTAIQNLSSSSQTNAAYSLLGKRVEAQNPATGISLSGIVSRVSHVNNNIRLMINNTEIGLSDIRTVYTNDAEENRRSTTSQQ